MVCGFGRYIAAMALLLALGGCTTPATEVLVVLDTDAPMNRVLTLTISVQAGRDAGPPPVVVTDARRDVPADALVDVTPDAPIDGLADVTRDAPVDALDAPARDAASIDVGAPGVPDARLDVAVESAANPDVYVFRRGPGTVGVRFPASFAIVPAPGMARDGSMTIHVLFELAVGPNGEPAISYRRVSRFSFTRGQTTVVQLFLAVGCGSPATGCRSAPASGCTLSTRCDDDHMACDRDRCVPLDITPTALLDGGLDTAPALDARADVNRDGCVPVCTGRVCGTDSCGGACGSCALTLSCNPAGQCVSAPCTPNCTGRVCGPDPMCGTSCGACPGTQPCNAAGQCVCAPTCGARVCGPDPTCGRSCGSCGAGESCNGAGQCVPSACVPNCSGRSCGPDPTCGTSCGACASPATCDGNGACSCTPNCSGRTCGPDPMCGTSCGGCSTGQSCSGGSCAVRCGDGICAPGVEDCRSCLGDCPCPGGLACLAGVCASCVPNCSGRNCGPDGCGGSCGSCPGSASCVGGNCAAACGDSICAPGVEDCGNCPGDCPCPGSAVCFSRACCTPNCAGHNCGSDGCGGSCGSCGGSDVCRSGSCCTPDCGSVECGPDPACGVSCPGCPGGTFCNGNVCEPI